MTRRAGAAALAIALLACSGCSHKQPPPTPVTRETGAPFHFSDATASAGIDFKHVNGAGDRKWLPETMGSGCAWIDFDGDGYQDLLLVNSRPWPSGGAGSRSPLPTCKLYRNLGSGRFQDVTHAAGLDVPMFGMGATVGDYDNDGRPDIYITALGRNYLFRNLGGGKFRDVSDQAGLRDGGWSTSAAWVDYDLDGKLDLVVGHYVKWSPETDIPFMKNGHRTYGTPQQYVGEPLALYHNEGGGHFRNVTRQAGMLKSADGRPLQGKTLGITICDSNGDGFPDIACANDTEPNYLFENQQGKGFREIGVDQGIAYPDNAQARGAMGIDAADYDGTGRESIAIGNFSNQMLALYHNEGSIFRDVASQAGVGPPSLLSLSFGLFFCDLDNDGLPDLFVANGHIDDDIAEDQQRVEYAERPLLFHNSGRGIFRETGVSAGPAMAQKRVARGAAYADYDLTGYPSIALVTNNGPAALLHNDGGSNGSVRIVLKGDRSNASAIGALVQAHVGTRLVRARVHSGSSYCSQSELPLTIGLGSAAQADQVVITWPFRGAPTATYGPLKAGQTYTIDERRGIVSVRALTRR